MCVAKSVRTITRQRILISWRRFSAIKPSLIPVLGVTMQLGVREIDISPLLNRHPTKLSVGTVHELCATVQIKEISEQLNVGAS